MDIHEDLQRHEHLNEEEGALKDWGPWKWIVGLFLLIVMVSWTFAYYAGRDNPEPRGIPGRSVVVPHNISWGNSSMKADPAAFSAFITPGDVEIKRIADRIVGASCRGSRLCAAKSLYYFVRDEYGYIADPVAAEYVESPREFLSVGGGDCESGAIALASLMGAVGISADLVLLPGHAIVAIKLPEAPQHYQRNGFVYLDWTCTWCAFGEISRAYAEMIG